MTRRVKSKPDNSELNDLIVENILSNILVLDRGRAHLAKMLMGLELWATFDKGVQHHIVSVIYKLVEKGLLPLVYAGKTSSNQHTYWIA